MCKLQGLNDLVLCHHFASFLHFTKSCFLVENCVKEDQKRSVDIVDSNGPILESTA